jgi:nitrate/nitrite-specific signal transduction histidine kinase
MGVRLVVNGAQGRVIVEDDGVGIGVGSTELSDGIGLRLMKYRATAMGGVLSVLPRSGGGTVVMVTFRVAGVPEPSSQAACV